MKRKNNTKGNQKTTDMAMFKGRKDSAVTLVALSVTIIVLLILSSITIAALTGENSLIEQSRWAAFSQEMTDLDEQIEVKQIQNSRKMIEDEEKPLFTIPSAVKSLPKSLKMEILYVRENMPDNKEPTKDYYIEDLLDYLVDDSQTVKGLYYVSEEIAGDGNKYIYDEFTDTAYKINGIRLRGKEIHSYKYGCKVLGMWDGTELDDSQYLLATESEAVTVNGETYYAPNLKGFNGLTTSAEYYSQDDKKTTEVSISLHMNQQVVNEIKDGSTTYTWYDYANKKWANIKTTANGYEAWWVWIPRYAYKIGEVDSSTIKTKGGEIDIIYVDLEGNPLDKEKYGETLPEGYIVHPAFTTDGKSLKGIWVSKYKPSYGKYTKDDLEMSQKIATPDLSNFDAENTYLIKYSNDGNTIESETKLADIGDLSSFNNDNKWYNYENKLWANVKTTANGQEAWWVWIPRYAYRLPDNPNDDTEIIFIDTNNKPIDTEKYGSKLPDDFIVQPAFDQDTDSNGNPLTGIWISKYKPSHVKDTSDDIEMSNTVKEPDLSGFDAENTYLIKYSSDGKTVESETKLADISDISSFNSDGKWYSYQNKIWANIKTVANGQESWWVWIPRYAYRLPENPNDDTEIIFIDTDNRPLEQSKYGSTLPLGFTVHPAFNQDTDSGGNALSGVWVSKYKPSKTE